MPSTPQPRNGKRKQGRPKLLYPEYIAKLINNEVQPTIEELRKIAVERTEWSSLLSPVNLVCFQPNNDDDDDDVKDLIIKMK